LPEDLALSVDEAVPAREEILQRRHHEAQEFLLVGRELRERRFGQLKTFSDQIRDALEAPFRLASGCGWLAQAVLHRPAY
jgi:hypothetical protein